MSSAEMDVDTRSSELPTEPPLKKRRLSDPVTSTVPGHGDDAAKEMKCGITAYINPQLPGFSGVLKQRYTDFLVNEILPNGEVLHLTSLRPEKFPNSRGNQQPKEESKGPFYKAAEVVKARDDVKDVSEQPQEGKQETAHTDPKQEDEESKPAGAESNTGNMETSRNEVHGIISEQHLTTVQGLLGKDVTDKVLAVYSKRLSEPLRKPKDFATVLSDAIKDRERRTSVHKAIREAFDSKLETTTLDDDTISITVASSAVQARGSGRNQSNYNPSNYGARANNNNRGNRQPTWEELGGDFLHFTLFKENKDTMESVSFLASQLRVQPRSFQFSGTKDRRAVTVQRCSAYRIKAGDMAGLNSRLRYAKVGDFKHSRSGLELGELSGNEFVVTLRDCHFPGEEGLAVEARLKLANTVVHDSVEAFKTGGYLNYFGLQRFGSFATSTDEVGLKLLQGNLEGAVADILRFNPAALEAAEAPDDHPTVSHDDIARAKGISVWLTTHNAYKALEILPRKFSAESSIIRHLGARNNHSNDFQGALGSIQRNLRLMYVHAYQSLVWNFIAGKRWELFGHRVVEGDLVLINENKDKEADGEKPLPTLDEQGEPIVQPAPEDRATRPGDDYEHARALTAEQASSGKYSIFDVVLPTPGYDVMYPPNPIGDEYKSFMASERGGGLDPYDMRRSWKDLSLSGGYRKLLARPGDDMRFEIKTYSRAEDQLVETDLEKLMRERAEKNTAHKSRGGGEKDEEQTEAGTDEKDVKMEDAEVVQGDKIAVILTFKLGSSQYATMALRELMKEGGVITYKSDFSGGR